MPRASWTSNLKEGREQPKSAQRSRQQYGAWGVLAGVKMLCWRWVSGKQKAQPIALGISGSCSFCRERRKLSWRQLVFWLSGIWVENKGLKKQVSQSSVAKTSCFGCCTETKSFLVLFYFLVPLWKCFARWTDMTWGVMPGELLRWLGLMWTWEPSSLRLWQHRAHPHACARHR